MDDITRKRFAEGKFKDNSEVTPIMCLERALDDLKSGREKATKVVVIFVDDAESHWDWWTYLANISRVELGCLYSMIAWRHFDKWYRNDF